MIVFAAAIAVLAGAGEAREAAKASLTRAEIAIQAAGFCAAGSPRWEERFAPFDGKFFAAQDRIEGFLGVGVRPETVDLMNAHRPMASDCTNAFVRSNIDKAFAALTEVERNSDRLEAVTSKGAWLGLLPLCADTVQSAMVEISEVTGDPAAGIELMPEAEAELVSYSRGFLDGVLSARISVRLNGAMMARPAVFGEIRGRLALSGPTAGDVEALVTESLNACAGQ